ncbi:MAG: site-specific integrase [Gracilimonas sp.]|uniref:site-specific integrase n=1 Tax=Gracilimonas sp. TaxID=1974203 RepID=UPI0019B2FDFA|nr:site-specific integrase [Gracilimonas sp.]MBD3615853.1 site-specific integrase [Gracilimonas sp.]
MPATFKFYLREDRPDNRGFCPVYLRITLDRKKKYMNTGIRIKPRDWNPDKEEVRKSYSRNKKEVNHLNQELDIIRSDAEQAGRVLFREKRASADAIKKKLEYASKDNFFVFADEYQKAIKDKSFYSWKQNKVAINKVKDFHGSNHLPFNLIDPDFLNRLVDHLQRKYGNKASTIQKNFAAIKAILDKAVLAKLIPSNPVESKEFSMPKKNKDVTKTKLSLEQITAIEKLELQAGTNLWHARNAFLLSFYFCGMRFGDVAELRWENVRDGRLTYQMNKTGTDISIPIKDGARAILERYKDEDNNGYIFPFLSSLSKEQRKQPDAIRKQISTWNAVVNGQDNDKRLSGLKEIAKMAGIDEDISMHVARHSFAQYGVNDREIPPYKMMMLLGHKSVKTTMQYLKSLDLKTVDNVMDEIF